jgi:hypothetical protein
VRGAARTRLSRIGTRPDRHPIGLPVTAITFVLFLVANAIHYRDLFVVAEP